MEQKKKKFIIEKPKKVYRLTIYKNMICNEHKHFNTLGKLQEYAAANSLKGKVIGKTVIDPITLEETHQIFIFS